MITYAERFRRKKKRSREEKKEGYGSVAVLAKVHKWKDLWHCPTITPPEEETYSGQRACGRVYMCVCVWMFVGTD